MTTQLLIQTRHEARRGRGVVETLVLLAGVLALTACEDSSPAEPNRPGDAPVALAVARPDPDPGLPGEPLGPGRRIICVGDEAPTPFGWVQAELYWDPSRCPKPADRRGPGCIGCENNNAIEIVKLQEDARIGSRANVCYFSPVPPGWKVTERDASPGCTLPRGYRLRKCLGCTDAVVITRVGLESGVKGHWTFDSCGFGEPIIGGIPACVSSPRGNAVAFDGIADYVATPVDGNTNPLTIATWFKADDVTGERSIVDSDEAFLFGQSLIIGYWDGDATLDVQYHDGHYDSPFVVVPGQWHHAVARFEERRVSLYVDGQLIGRQEHEIPILNLDGSSFRFGRHNVGDPQWFEGEIDEVTIWDWALTDEQVAEAYNR